MEMLNHDYFMDIALGLARGARGQTGINPVVGCVIVKEGRVIGMGAHLKRGSAHAEIHALEMAGPEAEGSTVYVTLEPCSHHGQTPPCSDRLIAEKVARVVVACTDPNPAVAGQGIERLEASGIQVIVGVREQEAIELNEMFNKFIVTRMPFVTLKTASTLDGRVASRTGDSKWITGETARAFVHTLRHRHQAIMVGVNTVIADDPRLNIRADVPGIDPIRIVVDSHLRIPEKSLLLNDGKPVILVTTGQAPRERMERLKSLGAEIVTAGNGLRVNLPLAMKRLGELEIGSILLEGGGRLNGSMLEAGLIDKLILFYAPKIIGGKEAPTNFVFEGFAQMKDAIQLDRVRVDMVGPDICLTGYPLYGKEDQ